MALIRYRKKFNTDGIWRSTILKPLVGRAKLGRIPSALCFRFSRKLSLPVLVYAAMICAAATAQALDHVTLKRNSDSIQISGKVLVEAQNGGLLLLGPDGVLWMIQPEEIVEHTSDAQPFEPLSADKIAAQLLAELPNGFRIHQTANYVICYNTSPAYAQWCGALFERLFRGFYTYWSHLGVELQEPEIPLIALVFDSEQTYAQHVRKELGDDVVAMIGFYNMQTNRVNMYDLTGIEVRSGPGARVSSAARINQILSQPSAEPTVATIVHEATHQLAYNSGLQVRFAANPFWVSEGLAVYFETPDLSSSKGWRGIGTLSRRRLLHFHRYLAHRPADSLVTLLSDDRRFRDRATASDSYAEAWALNYFLLRTRTDDYVAYLKRLSQKTPHVEDDAATRVAEFKAFFGSDLKQLDDDFVRYMRQRR